ncbi:MAG: polymerase sigma factor, sigma-70 family [Chthonomonadaceae bacterium]|nr:polymerase sigma factor, sigma-70 family [Chthonomonadaceae bacterium]
MTMTRITTPSQQQFEQLVQCSRRRAYNLAYRLTGNAADTEDITQDAYLRAWRHFGSYNADRSFESWLFRIITNRALDLYRHKKRARNCSLDAPRFTDTAGNSPAYEQADPAADPERIVLGPLLEERLEAALLRLPTDYRKTILLCDVEQYTYQEIADRMQCALGTVRSRIHRARRLLRSYLEIDSSIRPSE